MSTEPTLPFRTTLQVKDQCLCFAAQRAARALARRFDEAFRPLGLTNQQYSLLMSLNRPSPPKMSAIAQFLGMDRTTLTAALKPLENRGLVTVTSDPKDGRGRLLTLTPMGHSLLIEAVPIWERTLNEIEAGLGPEGAEALRRGLWALA